MTTTDRTTENANMAEQNPSQMAPPRRIPIVYMCQHGFCTAVQHQTHLEAIGNIAVMAAVNTNVGIRFGIAGSPFAVTEIDIPQGQIREETVVANGTFPYTLSCRNPTCPTPAAPPEMIVP